MSQQDCSSTIALAPAQIFQKAVEVGTAKATMPLVRLFALSVLAGLYIGMGGMFMLIVKADSSLSFAASALLSGLVFSLGLFAVLVAGAELFTGNALLIIGKFRGSYGWPAILRNWAVVYAGNLCGALLLAFFLKMANFAGLNGGAVGDAALAVATAKCTLATMPDALFFRALMCNVLVCLGVWMGFAGKTVTDKLAAVAMPVCAFVACGFEHCVANMFFLPYAALLHAPGDVVSLGAICTNIGIATIGNIIGGSVVFAGLYLLAYGRDER